MFSKDQVDKLLYENFLILMFILTITQKKREKYSAKCLDQIDFLHLAIKEEAFDFCLLIQNNMP